MITRPAACIQADGRVLPESLSSVFDEHGREALRMSRLRAYYDGKHPILSRERTEGLPNNRLVHNYPRYITTMASSYLIGNPVAYALVEEGEAEDPDFSGIMDLYNRNNTDAVDSELAKHASIYGKACEIVFTNENGLVCSATLDPRKAFVVYDTTVESNPLFGVYREVHIDETGGTSGYVVQTFTKTHITTYHSGDQWSLSNAKEISHTEHPFRDVPLIEYWNNEEERGDFEDILSLVDAYNVLQSDRVNDKEQFVDALLVISGAALPIDPGNEEKSGRDFARQLRINHMLDLPTADARAEWLSKSLTEADVEVLKDALKTDMHKMSFVPDLSDKQFASNSSGVAMKYKLLGLEQLTKIKERWFREALLMRLKLFATIYGIRGATSFDVGKVQVTFTHSLPNNDLEASQMIRNLQDVVPDAILLKQLSFIDDPKGAMEVLEAEREAKQERANSMLNDYRDANAEPDQGAGNRRADAVRGDPR